MPHSKPNLVCFMAQKMIPVRETGFVNALEIKGTIPNSNVVRSANGLSKTQHQPFPGNLQDIAKHCDHSSQSIRQHFPLKPESRGWNGEASL